MGINKSDVATPTVGLAKQPASERIYSPLIKQDVRLEVGASPIRIQASTSTDWAAVGATTMVGIGSIATALIVARLSNKFQMHAVKSNIASFRHKWIEELRECGSKLLALAIQIKISRSDAPDMSLGVGKKETIGELVSCQARIVMMLDKSKIYNLELIASVEHLVLEMREGDATNFDQAISEFMQKMQVVLELAWQDVKKDLRAEAR